MKRWAGLFGAILFVAACSHSSAPAGPPPPVALYTPAAVSRLSPYPSNRYAKAHPSSPTGIRVAIGPENTNDQMLTVFPDVVRTLNELDGFSTLGGVSMSFSDDLDATTIQRGTTDAYATPDSPMALVDVDPQSPERGRARGLVPRYYTTTGDDAAATTDYTLVVEPSRPLRPRTRYAFVLTDAVKSTAGRALTASADTKALLSGTAEGDYGDSVRAALPIIESATGITKDHVVLATVFTTMTVHDVLLGVASDRRAAPPPKMQGAWTIQQDGGATDKRVRFVGHFDAPEYRKAKPDAKWDVQNGKPIVQSTANLEVYLSFSDKTVSGPRPIAIFQHGLGGDKDGTWGTTERLADLGIAVFGIDAPEHGSRSDPPFAMGKTDLLQAVTHFFGVNLDTKQFDMRIARDNFRQMAADQLELLRFIESLGTLDLLPVGAPDGVPDLDPTKIIYLGHSFGSVMAATFMALAPEIRASVWNVGGAGFTGLFHDSGLFSVLTKTLEPADMPKSELGRFFAMTQAILDPGDAANFAPYVTQAGAPGVAQWRPMDVLLQEVRHDNIVPNSSSERLARAAGLAQVSPVLDAIAGMSQAQPGVSANLPSGATGGIFQFEIAGGMSVDHGSLIFTTEGIKQYVTFFKGALAGGHGEIINPY